MAGEELEEHDAERVDVAGLPCPPAARLLRREVVDRAEGGSSASHALLAGRAGDAEVGDDGATVGPDEYVAGLDVAMHEAGGMRRGDCIRGLRDEARGPGGLKPALATEEAGEVAALDKFHDHVRPVVHTHVIDGHHVRMDDGRRATCLAG